MKHGILFAGACLLAAFAVRPASAADDSARLAKPGASLFSDDFAREKMPPKWRVGKGFWSIADGVVTIAENPEDKHGAYAYVTPNFPYKDIVAEFSVKFDGARSCSLMINDNKYKGSHAGHILKSTVYPGGKVDVADWKTGLMKNEIWDKIKKDSTAPESEKKQLRDSIKDKSAMFKTSADTTQWHVLRVEIVGDEMLTSIDGKPAAYLKSEGVDHPTKNAIGFEVGGKSVLVKDVKVWNATAAPEWTAKREEVIGSLKK